ncbi:MAG: hypothetical protein FWC56_01345 [Phycisphaerae bacterium]|nr:hypothetical protein [Phycisphaerae bacterium]
MITAASIFAAAMLTLGCNGSGTVKVVPVLRTNFTDTEPLVQSVRVTEAYWYIDHDPDRPNQPQVVVALKSRVASLLGREFDFDWTLSLVLDGMPAGSSRLYPLSADAIRLVQTCGLDRRRSKGWTGVAVLYAPKKSLGGDRLRGRFHVNVRQQQFSLLNGWTPSYFQAPMLVLAGDFEAVYDAEKGMNLRYWTEAEGFDRPPIITPPTTNHSASVTISTTRPATGASTTRPVIAIEN